MTHAALQCAPYRARHILSINPDASPEMLEVARIAQDSGPGYTVFFLGEPVAAAGFANYLGVTQVWAILTPIVKVFPIWFHHLFLKTLDKHNDVDLYAQTEGCHERWLRSLGFKDTDDTVPWLNDGAKLYVRRSWRGWR